MQTYGIFAVTPRGMSIKDDRDNGWVADIKWAFMPGAREERKFELHHMPVLKGAAAEGGRIRLEVTPRLGGEHLPAVMMAAHLRGNITVDEYGAVLCITRVTFDELETCGLGVDAILGSSNCLECAVSNQPTLNEQIQQELKIPGGSVAEIQQLQAEVDDLVRPAIDAAPLLTDEQDAPPVHDVPPPLNMTLDPLQPGEDLPFPIDAESGQQPSA
ncbi:hypothetical protein E7T09_04225 [Deinococcus sp. KSM4-11]|uniref:hypothetical protein n=1 Tax=Deinococcus sp. KSM4-11 TaxID=2568654 RepID=UPI0010A58B40|nr:hypothetical protein [Deinococcus sp. KSM4-11]THF88420.1 hypothetical protein E7T09_04225 [Deinococcus sp. KSM4-11]